MFNLQLCPKDRVCVVAGSGDGMRCFLVEPGEDTDTLVRALSKALGRPSWR